MLSFRGTQESFVVKAVTELKSKSTRKSVMVAPVAYGKSICIANIALYLDAAVIILQPNRELLLQNYEKFTSYGYQASICCISLKVKTVAKIPYTELNGKLVRCNHITGVTFATAKSIASQVDLVKAAGVKYMIIDECHLGTGSTSVLRDLIRTAKIKNVLGVTATALVLRSGFEGSRLRMLDKAKDNLFSHILHAVQIQEVVDAKYWSKLIYDIKVSELADLKYNRTGSDFTRKSMADSYDVNFSEARTIAAVKDLRKERRKSILIFVPDIDSGTKLSSKIPGSRIVHSKLPIEERKFIIDSFKSLELDVVINVEILTTGFDHPLLDAVVLVRPTASIALYYQMLGRAARIHPDKLNAKIVDLSGNVSRFGKIEDLNYDYIEGFGWGLFNKEMLLTNFPIQAEYRPTKADLVKYVAMEAQGLTKDMDITLWFGKFKNKKISQVPDWYLTFMLDKFNFSTVKMQTLKEAITIILKNK